VHHIGGTRVQINVLLNRSLLSFLLIKAAAWSIQDSKSNSHSPVHHEIDTGVDSIENHGRDECVTDSPEEACVEVTVASTVESVGWHGLLRQICVDEQHHERRVEELTKEGDNSDSLQLTSLSFVTNP